MGAGGERGRGWRVNPSMKVWGGPLAKEGSGAGGKKSPAGGRDGHWGMGHRSLDHQSPVNP